MMPNRSSPGLPADNEPAQATLPKIFCDPFAAFGPTEIDVDFLGATWTLPAMTAADWLKIIWVDELAVDDIFPNLFDAQRETFEALLLEEITVEDIFETAMAVIEAAAGFRWWFALNLASAVRAAWSRIGGLVVAQVQADTVSLGAWLVVALNVMQENVDHKKLSEFLTALNTPPAGAGLNAFDEETEAEAFLAAMQQSL